MSLDSLLNMKINSAAKYEQKVSDAATSITIITSEDIRNYGWENLSDVLNAVRSLYITFDRNYEYLGIRGFSRPSDLNNRILFMVDGHPLNEPVWGQGPLGIEFAGLNLDNVERVEILRGPGSALYGNYAMLGTVNIVMKEGKQQNEVKVSAETGSYGRTQASIAAGKKFNNELDLSFSARGTLLKGQRLYFEEYDDSTTNQGIANRLDWRDSWGIHAAAAWKGFRLSLLYTDRIMGVPTAPYFSRFGDIRTKVRDNHLATDLKYVKEINDQMELTARVNLDRYGYEGDYPYPDTAGGMTFEFTQEWWAGADARLRWDVRHNNRLVAGVEYQNYFSVNHQYMLQFGDRSAQELKFYTLGTFIQDEWQIFPRMRVTAGVRYDILLRGLKAFAPRASMVYHPWDGTTFKLLFSDAYRAPTAIEVLLLDPIYSIPNPTLTRERMRSFEFSAEQKFAKYFLITGAVFHNQISDLIDQVPYPLDSSLVTYANISAARTSGAELELSWRIRNKINGFVSATIQKSYNSLNEDNLTNSPPVYTKFGLTVPIQKMFRLSMDGVAEVSRLTLGGNQTDPYLLLNAAVVVLPRYKPTQGLSLSFRAQNLLNFKYAHPGGAEHLQDQIFQNGFNIRAKIEYSF